MAGVKLPRFEVVQDGAGGNKMDMTGLGKGGAQLQACRKKHLEARSSAPHATPHSTPPPPLLFPASPPRALA